MEEKIKTICDLYQSGLNFKKIAKQLHIGYKTISKVLNDANIELRGGKIDKDIEQKIILDYENHLSMSEISRIYKLNPKTVREILRRNDIVILEKKNILTLEQKEEFKKIWDDEKISTRHLMKVFNTTNYILDKWCQELGLMPKKHGQKMVKITVIGKVVVA